MNPSDKSLEKPEGDEGLVVDVAGVLAREQLREPHARPHVAIKRHDFAKGRNGEAGL